MLWVRDFLLRLFAPWSDFYIMVLFYTYALFGQISLSCTGSVYIGERVGVGLLNFVKKLICINVHNFFNIFFIKFG